MFLSSVAQTLLSVPNDTTPPLIGLAPSRPLSPADHLRRVSPALLRPIQHGFSRAASPFLIPCRGWGSPTPAHCLPRGRERFHIFPQPVQPLP